MRFYPPNNEEIDTLKDTKYLKTLLNSWRHGLNLVTRFDIVKGKIYHIFMKAYKPDINKGILRVWTKKGVTLIYQERAFVNSEKETIFNKLDMLDRVFNRNGKLYSELTGEETFTAYSNMMMNAKEHFSKGNFIMAAYFARGAMLYRNSSKANELLNKCRQKCLYQDAA